MSTPPAYVYVLTALASGPRHGLGIAEIVSAFTDGRVLLGPGTLYRCLSDLTEDGLIRRCDPPAGASSARRKYYELTEQGRDELGNAVAELHALLRAADRGIQGLDPAGVGHA